MQPSIKGSVFGLVLGDLRKLVDEGKVSHDEGEALIASAGLKLDDPVRVSGWYDIGAYGRMLEVLKEVVGGGQNAYLCARGARTAEALLVSDIYQQMEYLSRTQLASARTPEERFRAFGRDLKLLGTLAGNIYNFGRSETRTDPDHPDRYLTEFAEAEAFPEAACWTGVGFRNRMAEEHGTPDLWYWERPRPDVVLYRMKRAL